MSILFFPVFQLFPSVRSFLPPLKRFAECVPACWHSGVLAHGRVAGWRGKSQHQHREEVSFHRGYSLAWPKPVSCMAYTSGLPWPHTTPTATHYCSPMELPKNIATPTQLSCSSLHTLLLDKGWRGIPEPHRGGCPRSP